MRTRTDTIPRRIQRPGMFAGGDGSTLSLDFTAMSSLDTRFTFTRSTTATYINSSGVVTSMGAAASNDPTKARFDYDPTTLTARGLLIEGAATNLLVRSEDMATATFPGWGVRNNLNSTGWTAQSSPDGASTAVKLIPTTTNATHYLGTGTLSGITSGVQYTISVFVKASGYSVFGIAATNSQSRASFNLSTQSSSSYGISNTRTITAYPNGWYRVSMTWTTSATSFDVWMFVQNTEQDPVTSWAGDNANSVTVWGAQLELGSGASSYIPTGSSTVQRTADSCAIALSSFGFNTSAGTIFADWYRKNGDAVSQSGGPWNTDYVASTTRWLGVQNAIASNTVTLFSWSGQTDIINGATRNKAAATYGAFNAGVSPTTFCVNNSSVTSANRDFNPSTATYLTIGAASSSAGSSPAYGVATRDWLNNSIRSIKYWPSILPDATLQSLTA